MAYIDQTDKKKIAEAAKPILISYGVKGNFSIRNHSTLIFTIASSSIDFIGNYKALPGENEYIERKYLNVNIYHLTEHFTDTALNFLTELKDVMMEGNYNNSDPMTDYYDVGWYIDINIGRWNKPYQLIKENKNEYPKH